MDMNRWYEDMINFEEGMGVNGIWEIVFVWFEVWSFG